MRASSGLCGHFVGFPRREAAKLQITKSKSQRSSKKKEEKLQKLKHATHLFGYLTFGLWSFFGICLLGFLISRAYAAPLSMPELTHQNAFRDERRAAMLSLAVSSLLLAIKFGAYWLTASAAIFSDAMESIINVLASAFALYSVILAHSPADRSHPYGHGKIEFLAAGFEGGMILLAAVFIAAQAIHQLVFGPRLHEQAVNVGLLLIALA